MIYCKATDTKQPNNPDLTDYCQVDVKIPEATATQTPSQASNVETVNLAGGETTDCYIAPEDVDSSINIPKYRNDNSGKFRNNINVSGKGYDSLTGCAYAGIRALRTGQVTVLAKYNGQTLKRWNVNVTSNWSDYVGYVNWRKNVESQIWNSNMNTVQKLDACPRIILNHILHINLVQMRAVYAYTENVADCITASEFMGDFAKDINCTVRYYNVNTGKQYEHIVDAYGALLEVTFSAILC